MSHSIEVYSSSCYPFDERESFSEHIHGEVYQVFFCVEGQDHRDYGGKYVALRKGEFMLVPPGQPHGMKRCQGPTLDIKFGVFDDLLAEQLQLLAGRACSAQSVEYLFSQVTALTRSAKPFSLRLIALYLETIFCTLLSDILCENELIREESAVSRIPSDMEASERTTRVLTFMEHFVIDPAEKFSIDAWSRDAGYSEKYLYRQFSREIGVSPVKYFNHRRIGRAKEFLRFSDMKITDIAHILGYGDLQYFVKYFKKNVGLSPSDYRERYRQSLHEQINRMENE